MLKQVIFPAELKADSFVSSIFTTMKPDGSHQTILNLKKIEWKASLKFKFKFISLRSKNKITKFNMHLRAF